LYLNYLDTERTLMYNPVVEEK